MADDFLDRFSKGVDNLESINNTEVPFEEIFSSEFVSAHTKFDDIYEFLKAGNLDLEHFHDIPTETIDPYIKANSDFETWEDFKDEGGKYYVLRQLGFNS